VYVDGVRRSWSEGHVHALTWPVAELASMTIGIGQRYTRGRRIAVGG
jgi:hypothetical protein